MKEKKITGVKHIRQFLPDKKGYIGIGAATLAVSVLWYTKYRAAHLGELSHTFYHIIPFFAVLAVFSAGVCLVMGIWIKQMKKINWPAVLFAFSMALGMLYMFILPPFAAPDEASHFATAYRLSSQMMGTQAVNEKGRVVVRSGDVNEYINAYPTVESYDYIAGHLFDKDQSEGMIEHYSNPVNTSPVLYLPQALGISIARILNLGYVGLAFLARFINLLVVSAGFALSIYWIPFGKKILFSFCTLPMTLNLIASVSYDGMVIMLSFLFISYCLRLAYEKEKTEIKDIVMLALLMGLLAPCKIVYAPLIGLCLLIPKKKFGNTRFYVISACIVLGVALISALLVNGEIMKGYATASSSDYVINWTGQEQPGYTASYLLQHPGEFFSIMFRTAKDNTFYYVKMMLGLALGSIDQELMLDDKLLLLFTVYLILCALPISKEPGKKINTAHKLWIVFLVLAIIALTFFSMLVAWTPIGSPGIMGIQGRYFLPVAPLVMIVLFRDNILVLKNDISKYLVYGACVANLIVTARMFGLLIFRS